MSRKLIIVVVIATVAVLTSQASWPAGGGQSASASTTTPAASASDTSEKLQEVTVTAHRAELVRRVSKFVSEIAAVENGEGIPLWQAPVCPLVSGLSEQEGEYILDRLSEVARTARVPLAGEHCRPNLYILVHPQPKELLRAMEKRNFVYTFGYDASAMVVDNFISTPRAVRVWYRPHEETAEGLPIVGFCPPYPKCLHEPNTNRLKYNVVWTLSHVFVIVDETRLQAVSRGQLADYLAMVALVHVKPGAKLVDVPTILKLFDGSPQAAPAGMTDWDMAFLKAAYATDQAAKLQRSEIAHQMVSELKP
jgi:hypothetical protein